MGVRREHRRHSQHVTRTKRWKVLRMDILERDRFRCRSCGCAGRLEVDHVQPVRTHPELAFDPANLQALCPSCHTRKTRLECGHPPRPPARKSWDGAVRQLERKRGLFSIPHDTRRSAIPVELVCGPPGSGKSTYVRAHAKPGDVVIDFDEHLKAVGGQKWDTDQTLVRAAFRSRAAVIRSLADRRSGRAFLIVTAPSKTERAAWHRALGLVTERLLAVDPETCKARIKADPERSHAVDRMCRAVDQWWTVYAAERGETETRDIGGQDAR